MSVPVTTPSHRSLLVGDNFHSVGADSFVPRDAKRVRGDPGASFSTNPFDSAAGVSSLVQRVIDGSRPTRTDDTQQFTASQPRINQTIAAADIPMNGVNLVLNYTAGMPLFFHVPQNQADIDAIKRIRESQVSYPGEPLTQVQHIVDVTQINYMCMLQAQAEEDPRKRWTPDDVFEKFKFAGLLTTDKGDPTGRPTRNLVIELQHRMIIPNRWHSSLIGGDKLHIVAKMIRLDSPTVKFRLDSEAQGFTTLECRTLRSGKRINYVTQLVYVSTQKGTPTSSCLDADVVFDLSDPIPERVCGRSYQVGQVIENRKLDLSTGTPPYNSHRSEYEFASYDVKCFGAPLDIWVFAAQSVFQ